MRGLLAPLGMAFEGVSCLRRNLYSRGLLKSIRLPKPVVSIGNLTVGGTGKTPMVDAILSQFESEGKKACVLTRGYGRGRPQKTPVVLTEKIAVSNSGDEPSWLARRHPHSLVVVGADRVKSAEAVRDKNVDIFLLDDGFQHEKMKKDYDIVLLDCTRPLWHYHPLPWGYSRSSFASLERADLVVLTRTNQVSQDIYEKMKGMVQKAGVQRIISSSIHLVDGQENLEGSKTFLVSGVGNPESFKASALEAKVKIVGEKCFSDHHIYDSSSLMEIVEEAHKVGADIILTTEKDAVKIAELERPTSNSLPFVALRVSLKFTPSLPKIYELACRNFS